MRLDLLCAQATVLALAARADLLITSMRPRALQACGLDWSRTHAAFPRLSHVEIVGEGGDRAGGAGHDLTYQAVAGLLTPPAMPRTVFADMFAAERAIAGRSRRYTFGIAPVCRRTRRSPLRTARERCAPRTNTD